MFDYKKIAYRDSRIENLAPFKKELNNTNKNRSNHFILFPLLLSKIFITINEITNNLITSIILAKKPKPRLASNLEIKNVFQFIFNT